jgi:hypothetical protein
LAGTARIYIIKSRFGSDGAMYPCQFDTSVGKIDVYDKSTTEGQEILEKTKTQQENMKEMFGKAWDKTHGKKDGMGD